MKQNTEVGGAIKIDSNIPIPEIGRVNSVASVVKRMKVGDSILVTMRQRNACSAAAYLQKMKILTRSQEGDLVRVWRVE